MKISKRTQYGLTAMTHLAKNKNKKAVSIRQISNIEKVPFEFLSKIFSDFEKAGLVEGRHGANGGYVLAKNPAQIAIMDIVGLLEKINTVDCQFCAKSKKCLTKNVWGKIDLAIEKTLRNIKLSELVK